MRDFFEGIKSFFENIAFAPHNFLREIQLDSWFLANILNWIFVIIAFAALVYWMRQLKIFNDNNEEDTDPTAHSFLG